MKKYLYVLFVLVLFLSFNLIAKADPETEEKTNEYGVLEKEACSDSSGTFQVEFKGKKFCYDEKEGVYCNEKEETCVKVNKGFTEHNAALGTHSVKVKLKNKDGDEVEKDFYTIAEDPVIKSDNTWWKTIVKCDYKSDGDNYTAFFTDQIISYKGDNKEFLQIFPISTTKCLNYKTVNINNNNRISVCSMMIKRESKIEDLKTKYTDTSNPKYHSSKLVSEYKKVVEEIKELCKNVTKYTDYNDGCVEQCIDLSKKLYDWNEAFGVTDSSSCGFSSRLISWILNIVKWIKYIIPVAVIVLGMLDFIKATGSDKDDDMKKAQGRFVKRLIAAALIFLVPLLVEFVLTKLGFDYNSCGIF